MKKMTDEQKREILVLEKGGNFWKVICEFIDESIERIEEEKSDVPEELKEMPAEKFKIHLLVLEAKKNILQDLKNYPDNLIAYLAGEKPNIENLDPYTKPS